MTIGEWMKNARETLNRSGCPDPEIDSRWIAEDVLNMTTPDLRFESQNMIDPEKLERMNEFLRRRAEGEPVQYILRRADFMGLKMYVDDRVLIPRPETETLVEAVVVALRGMKHPAVLDLCTGSGAIGISVKNLVDSADVTLSDLSLGALEVAHKNAHELNVDVSIRHGDLFKAVGRERFDLIVSNPPYVRKDELAELQRELCFEPVMALEGGLDGLDFYRRIAAEAGKHLNPGGSIYLECGAGEARDVLQMLRNNLDCVDSGTLKDLSGIERIIWARSK